jgi:hypothetical protein
MSGAKLVAEAEHISSQGNEELVSSDLSFSEVKDGAHVPGVNTTTQTERQRLFAPAVTLFGERWQSPLARATGYSQGHLQQVFTGIRALTVDVEQAILSAYRQEIVRAEERAARARAGIIRILEAKG